MSNFNGQLVFYTDWITKMAGAYNYLSDTFKCILCSSSYTPDLAHDELADITNELSGSGYARQTCVNVSFETVNGLLNFDCDDVIFTATGGTLTPKYWVVYDDTTATDELVAYGLIDASGASVAVTDAQTLTLNFGAMGAVGEGVPAGGTTGQILAKINGTDYNTQWIDPYIPIEQGNFYLKTGQDMTVVLVSSAIYAFTINSLKNLKTTSGTITASIQIDGVSVTGLDALSVTSTPQSPNASALNSVGIGDRVTLVLASNASAVDVEFTMEATR